MLDNQIQNAKNNTNTNIILYKYNMVVKPL